MHPASIGNIVYNDLALGPCTAVAAVEILKTLPLKIEGLDVTVIGHSEIVGKPIAFLMMGLGATVTVCHHMTRQVAVHSRRADAVFVAVGRPGLVTGEMLKPGAALIDIGINRVEGPDGAAHRRRRRFRQLRRGGGLDHPGARRGRAGDGGGPDEERGAGDAAAERAVPREPMWRRNEERRMSATIIDGKAFAAKVRGQIATQVARLKADHGLTPGLAVILVGEDPASQVYVRSKGQQTVEVGMASFEHKLPAECPRPSFMR